MSTGEERPPTNTRKIKQDNERKFLYLAIFTLVIVGGVLIALVFGPESLFTALPCLLGGAGMILIPWLVLVGLQKWRDRMDESDGQ